MGKISERSKNYHLFKVANRVNLQRSHHKKKILSLYMVTDVNYAYCDGYFAIKTNTESLSYN